MNHKSYIINLDNPCNENWTSMSTIENGKYCSVCTKNVIDFTSLTDAEIIEQIEKTKGNLCGRFNNSQLNRIIEIQQKQHFGSSIYKLLTGLLFLSTANNVEAKEFNIINKLTLNSEVHQSNLNSGKNFEKEKEDSTKNYIEGKILDYENNPISYAVINLKNKLVSARSDSNGYFKLYIKDEFLEPEMILQINSLGYKFKELKIEAKNLPIKKEILIGELAIMGMPSIIVQKRKWWQRKKKSCH